MDGTEMKRDNSEKGFSLVEVMIALVVLLLGMLGIMGMQYYAVSGNANSRELRMATNLGQDMIESLKSTAYGNLSSSFDTSAIVTARSSEATISAGITFNRRWWVLPNCIALTLTGDDNSCTAMTATCTTVPGGVTVPVSAIRTRTCWTDKSGGVHAVTMDSSRWNKDEFY